MPNVQPDSVQTAPSTPVTIAVLGNDSGTGMTITALSTPASGTAVLNANQTVTYTPQAGFQGTDSFTYTVRDSANAFATGTVTVVVASANNVPVAQDDAVSTPQGTPVTINVLGNDSDADGDPLQVTAVGVPDRGSASVGPGGAVIYQPAAGFAGTDAFSYTLSDGRGGIDTAVITVMVTASNAAPVAVEDSVTTTRNTAVRIALLANDTDPDGDELALASLGTPANGRLAVEADSIVVYTPSTGFVGADSFAYTVTDGKGSTANGIVRIDVQRPNAAPVAVADSATTFANTPVSIAVLGNDTDADADALKVESVTVPARGTLAVAADQSLVYTPNTGFVGTDSFVYTVTDSRGGRATATVTVTVQADPAATTYTNGYQYRRRVVVPAAVVGGSLTNFPMLVRLSGDWLKGAAAGGRIRSNQGFDIRFESSLNAKLDHDIESYDAAAGTLVAWVRVPSLATTGDTTIFMYYGKTGMVATEASPAGVWRDYLAVWHLPSGVDRTGRGRDLTATNISATTLVGEAGSFNGTTSILTRNDATFLNGLSAYTAQAWIRASAIGSDRGFLSVGPITGPDEAQALCLRYDVQGAKGDGTNIILLEQAISDGRSRLESASNAQSSANQHLTATWTQGRQPILFIDGVATTPSWADSAERSGTTAIGTGRLQIGAASKDSANGGWAGAIDEVRLRGSALTSAWLQAEVLNARTPLAFYGVGGEDPHGAANRAPVALPNRATTTRGTAVSINVVGGDIDPDSDAMTLTAVGTAANGTVAILTGQARYTPNANFVGSDGFEYTISDGKGGTSTGWCSVEVTAPTPVGNDDRPFRNRFYGSGVHAEAVGNTRFHNGRPVCFRFRAQRSGTIRAIRWSHRYNRTADEAGYSHGNGGRLLVEIRNNDAARGNVPGSTVIGRTAELNNLLQRGFFDLTEFLDPKPQLSADQIYHIQFTQLATGDNAVSVNMLHTKVPIPLGGTGRFGPFYGDELAHLWYSGGTNGTWLQRHDRCPIFELHYADGQIIGQGNIYSHDTAAKDIGGNDMARQIFTVRDYTRTAAGVWFRIRWNGTAPADLNVQLETGSGTLIERIVVPRSAIAQSTMYDNPVPWIYRPFTQPRTLTQGQAYALRFSTGSGTYFIHAIQEGNSFGMNERATFTHGHAQYSTDGGRNWTGWSFTASHLGSGSTRTDLDLPVLFQLT